MSTVPFKLRLPSRRVVVTFFLVFLTVLLAGSAIAYGADEPKPTPTQNFGETFGSNDISGGQAKTLYETWGINAYRVPKDATAGDAIADMVNGLADFLMFIAMGLVAGVIQLVTFLFDMGDTSEISNGIAPMIGNSAGTLMLWLFPTAMAAGALVAWVQGTRDGAGSTFSQLAWVIAGGLLTTSLATSPVLWTNGVDTARTVTTDAVNGATADALSTNATWPVGIGEPSFEGQDSKTVMKRKAGDALWRNLAAMPWCMTTFGSTEACEKYGRGMLDAGGDNDKMKDFIRKEMMGPEGGDKSQTIRFTKGHDYWPRLGQGAMVVVIALVLAIVIVVLGFGAFACIILSWLLLIVGAFFAMLWVIPGPTREWGKNWFLALIGAVAGAVVKMLVFQAVLLLTIVVLNSSWNMGIRLITAIAVGIAGLGLNRTLENLVSHSGMGFMRTAASGYMAGRAARGAIKGLGRAGMAGLSGGRKAGGLVGGAGSSILGRLGKARSGAVPTGKVDAPLTDLGERRTSFRSAGALAQRGAAPTLALPSPTSAQPGSPSAQHELPAGTGSKGRHGMAFQAPTGSRPMPAQPTPRDTRTEGQRPMRVLPAVPPVHAIASTNSAPVGLPRGPRQNTPAPAAAKTHQQFRSAPQPVTIKGEFVTAGAESAQPKAKSGQSQNRGSGARNAFRSTTAAKGGTRRNNDEGKR